MRKHGLRSTKRWEKFLPFNPNVPDIEGCSPVNFLGVFCFRPGSREKQRQGMVKHIQCECNENERWSLLQKICCNLTVLHSLRVFVGKGRGKTPPFAFTTSRIRRRALGLRLLGLGKGWLGLVNLLWRLTVAVLFPLALLVGQLPVLRGRGHLVGLFHFEEHRRGGTVLHGPEFTDRGRIVLGSQHYDVTNTIMWVSVGGNLSS